MIICICIVIIICAFVMTINEGSPTAKEWQAKSSREEVSKIAYQDWYLNNIRSWNELKQIEKELLKDYAIEQKFEWYEMNLQEMINYDFIKAVEAEVGILMDYRYLA